MIVELLNNEQENQLSVINDPFKKDCVRNILMAMHTSYNGNTYWYGKVKFVNGKTEGEHRTSDHDTFEAMYVELKQVLESIK